MGVFLVILFGISLLGLFHSYLFYPLIMRWLAKGRQLDGPLYQDTDSWPLVSVIMSVYNEEKVIEQKIKSLLQLDYPSGKINIYIGSDCSSDQTNPILAAYAKAHPYVHFFPFQQRSGKPGVVNKLVKKAKEDQLKQAEEEHILLLTDASVLLKTDTLKKLVRHFKEQKIALVDANMVHTGLTDQGISKAEDKYISGEVGLKYFESVVWKKMIGPFGGCYALRAPMYSEVPANFLVDDFYIAMRVFEQGGLAINDLEAICYEAVSHEITEEYRRKARISAGNFQNMLLFKHLWWPPFKPLSFAFFSHKILRWAGPFFLILLLLCSGILASLGNLIFQFLFYFLVVVMLIFPFLDFILKKGNIHILPLRGLRYFILMNAALLAGFFKFLKGIQSNAWEPPKRH